MRNSPSSEIGVTRTAHGAWKDMAAPPSRELRQSTFTVSGTTSRFETAGTTCRRNLCAGGWNF
jgi:hypothetical protein